MARRTESHRKAPRAVQTQRVKGSSCSRQPEGEPAGEARDGRGRASRPALLWTRPLPADVPCQPHASNCHSPGLFFTPPGAASERNARGQGSVKELKHLGLVSGHPQSKNRLRNPTHVVPAHDAHTSLNLASGEAVEPPDGAISNDLPWKEDQSSGK